MSVHRLPVRPDPDQLHRQAKDLLHDMRARGEEANHLAPKSPQVHKFLGKCYMRAGRTREANDNYKQYLELAPNAPDAPFVKSMIK